MIDTSGWAPIPKRAPTAEPAPPAKPGLGGLQVRTVSPAGTEGWKVIPRRQPEPPPNAGPSLTSDLLESVNVGFGSMLDSVMAVGQHALGLPLQEWRAANDQIRNAAMARMSLAQKQSLTKKWLSTGPDAAWKDFRSYLGTIAQALPSGLATILTGGAGAAVGVGMRAGMAAGGAVLGAGDAGQSAEQDAKEAGLSAEDQHRAALWAMPGGALAGALSEALTGKLMRGEGGSFGARVGKEVASETGEEAATQASAEFGKTQVGLPFNPSNVGEAAIQGAVGAAGMSGPMMAPGSFAQMLAERQAKAQEARSQQERESLKKQADALDKKYEERTTAEAEAVAKRTAELQQRDTAASQTLAGIPTPTLDLQGGKSKSRLPGESFTKTKAEMQLDEARAKLATLKTPAAYEAQQVRIRGLEKKVQEEAEAKRTAEAGRAAELADRQSIFDLQPPAPPVKRTRKGAKAADATGLPAKAKATPRAKAAAATPSQPAPAGPAGSPDTAAGAPISAATGGIAVETGEPTGEEVYRRVAELVDRTRVASTSHAQRHLKVGAVQIMAALDRLQTEGVVTAPDRKGKRQVVPPEERGPPLPPAVPSTIDKPVEAHRSPVAEKKAKSIIEKQAAALKGRRTKAEKGKTTVAAAEGEKVALPAAGSAEKASIQVRSPKQKTKRAAAAGGVSTAAAPVAPGADTALGLQTSPPQATAEQSGVQPVPNAPAPYSGPPRSTNEFLQRALEAGKPMDAGNLLLDLLGTLDPDGKPLTVLPGTRLAELMYRLAGILKGSEVRIIAGNLTDPDGTAKYQALYSPDSGWITVDLKNSVDLTVSVLHEIVHAAVTVQLEHPAHKEASLALDKLREAFDKAWPRERGPMPEKMYNALGDNQEFITYALTDADFAAELESVMVPVGRGKHEKSIYQRIKESVRSLILSTYERSHYLPASSALDQLMDVVLDLSAWGPKERAEAMANLRGMGLLEPSALRVLQGMRMFRPQAVGGLVGLQVDKVFEVGFRARNALMALMSEHMLTETFSPLVDGIREMRNTVRERRELKRMRDGYQKTQRLAWAAVIDKVQQLRASDAGDYRQLAAVTFAARYASLWPDLPASDPANEYGISLPGGPAEHARLANEFELLSDEAKATFREITAQTARDHDTQVLLIQLSVLRQGGGIKRPYVDLAEQIDLDRLEPTKRPKPLSAEEIDKLPGLDEDTRKNMKLAMQVLGKAQGPYVPLRRYGNYFVIAKSESKKGWFTKADLDRMKEDRTDLVIHKQKQDGDRFEVTYSYQTVQMMDTQREARARVDELKNSGYGGDNDRVEFRMRKDLSHAIDNISSEQVRRLAEVVSNDPGLTGRRDMVYESILKYYLQRIPDTSSRKAELRARMIQGASGDLMRVLADHAQGTSYAQAQMRYGALIERATTNIEVDARTLRAEGKHEQAAKVDQLAEHFRRRDDVVHERAQAEKNPVARFVSQTLPRFTGVWFLTGVATSIINATQNLTVGLPYLVSRYGSGAPAVLMKAMLDVGVNASPYRLVGKQYARGLTGYPIHKTPTELVESMLTNVSPDERQLIDDLMRLELIDYGAAADLQSLSESGTDGGIMGRLADMGFILMQAIEASNRVAMALATARLAKARGVTDQKQLHRVIAHALDSTHYDYKRANQGILQQSVIARPFFVFKTYSMNMYYNILRNIVLLTHKKDRKAAMAYLGTMAATTAAFTGLAGVVFEPFAIVFGAILRELTGSDDIEEDLRKLIEEHSNKFISDLVVGGVPEAFTGVDMSRMGLSNLLQIDDIADRVRRADSVQAFAGEVAMTYAGAPIGIAENIERGATYYEAGDTMKAIGAVLPAAIAPIFKTIYMAQEGATTPRGYTLIQPDQLDFGDKVRTFLGFSTKDTRRLQNKSWQTTSYLRRISDRRSRLLDRYAVARRSGSETARQAALLEIRRFNADMRAQGAAKLQITADTIKSSIRKRAKTAHMIGKYGFGAQNQGELQAGLAYQK